MGEYLPAPRFVGQSVRRKEDARFLTGRGRYVDDLALPGMLHAAILRSPVARGRITTLDVEAARALPGVHAVYTAREINGQFQPLHSMFEPGLLRGIKYVLAEGEVCYAGDPVAIVVATDRYVAEDGLELIDVEFEPLEAVASIADAKRMEPALSSATSNIGNEIVAGSPGFSEAFDAASHVVTGTIAQGRVVPTPMETRGLIADPRPGGQLEIHMTSQNPHQAKYWLAQALAVNESDIRIVSPDVGGAFGQKYCFGRDMLSVIGAARLLRRPVKWIEDRVEALTAGGHSRTERLSLDLALNAEGHILATRLEVEDNLGADPTSGGSAYLMMLFHTGAYDVKESHTTAHAYLTNTDGGVPYRGPWGGETLVRELTMDKAARALEIDPVELRRRNIFTTQPHAMPMGVAIDGVTPRQTLDEAVDMIGYDAFRAEQARARAEGRHIGIGISLYIEPSAISFEMNSSDVAAVRLEPSGKVSAVMTCHSQGHGVETTMAQVIADELGVRVEDVSVSFGDTNAVGFGAGAGGSRQAVVSGGAAKVASGMLAERIKQAAAHLLQSTPDQLRLEDGQVFGPGGSSISLAELGSAAYFRPGSLPEQFGAGLEAQHRYVPPMFTFSNAAHICTVEVDVETGKVHILRYVVAEDCGVMLNPAVVEGQVSGGVLQAAGNVLWEEQHYDEYGNPGASTFKDYLLPLAVDAPRIEYRHLCTPSNTPTGAKGVGEGGAIVGPAAIYNAVVDALAPYEVKLEQLPLTPVRIVEALRAAKRQ